MLAKLSLLNLLILSGFWLSACVSSPGARSNRLGTGIYYESAFDDHNRAPASMAPPEAVVNGSDKLDPVYMRTQADYYFQIGESYSLKGQSQKAIEAFKMVLIYDSNSSLVHLRLSAEYVKSGMLSEALEHSEISVRKNPDSIDARILLGGLYSTLKAYEKALAQYEHVLKLEPANSEAAMYIGAVYAEQKKPDKAVKYFEKLAANPDYPTPYLAWYYIGRVRGEQTGKKYEKAAETAFKKALSLKPNHLDSVLALGSLYTKMTEDKKAIELYRNYQREQGPQARLAEILAQNYIDQEQFDLAYEQLEFLESYSEDSLSPKMKMALILIEQKKFDEAVTKLKEVLRQVPDSDKIRFYLAAIYEEMKKPSEAIEHFSRIPFESQYYSEAVVHAAYLLKQIGQVDKAIETIKGGLKKTKDSPQFYAIYASLLDDKKEYQEAAKILREGVEKFSDNVQLRFFLGTIEDRLGAKDKVVENMRKVIEMDSNHVQGLNYLAFTYAEADKNLEEAEKLARRALKLEPLDGYVLDTLGWILYKKGDFQSAIQILEAALKSQPNESIIAEHLGDAYQKYQLVDKARQMYRRAVENETDQGKQRVIQEKLTSLDKQELRISSDRQPASVDSP